MPHSPLTFERSEASTSEHLRLPAIKKYAALCGVMRRNCRLTHTKRAGFRPMLSGLKLYTLNSGASPRLCQRTRAPVAHTFQYAGSGGLSSPPEPLAQCTPALSGYWLHNVIHLSILNCIKVSFPFCICEFARLGIDSGQRDAHHWPAPQTRGYYPTMDLPHRHGV